MSVVDAILLDHLSDQIDVPDRWHQFVQFLLRCIQVARSDHHIVAREFDICIELLFRLDSGAQRVKQRAFIFRHRGQFFFADTSQIESTFRMLKMFMAYFLRIRRVRAAGRRIPPLAPRKARTVPTRLPFIFRAVAPAVLAHTQFGRYGCTG